MPRKVGVRVRQKRQAGGMNKAANNPKRLFASWNPTFDKLMNEVFAKPILTQEERQLVIINGTDKK